MPMKRYAAKFIMLPIMPSMELPANLYPQIVPMGAARLVTKEIIAKRKNIAIIAIKCPLELCLACDIGFVEKLI